MAKISVLLTFALSIFSSVSSIWVDDFGPQLAKEKTRLSDYNFGCLPSNDSQLCFMELRTGSTRVSINGTRPQAGLIYDVSKHPNHEKNGLYVILHNILPGNMTLEEEIGYSENGFKNATDEMCSYLLSRYDYTADYCGYLDRAYAHELTEEDNQWASQYTAERLGTDTSPAIRHSQSDLFDKRDRMYDCITSRCGGDNGDYYCYHRYGDECYKCDNDHNAGGNYCFWTNKQKYKNGLHHCNFIFDLTAHVLSNCYS